MSRVPWSHLSRINGRCSALRGLLAREPVVRHNDCVEQDKDWVGCIEHGSGQQYTRTLAQAYDEDRVRV